MANTTPLGSLSEFALVHYGEHARHTFHSRALQVQLLWGRVATGGTQSGTVVGILPDLSLSWATLGLKPGALIQTSKVCLTRNVRACSTAIRTRSSPCS